MSYVGLFLMYFCNQYGFYLCEQLPLVDCSQQEIKFVLSCTRTFISIQKGYTSMNHDDVIKWKHFPRNWPFVRGIHKSAVNSPHNGQ